MSLRSPKYLLALVFSLFIVSFSNVSVAQSGDQNDHEVRKTRNAAEQKEKKLKPGDILMEHIMDAHEFHFLNFGTHHVSLPLPVILYSPQKGFSAFMSSKFEHGEKTYKGYRLIDEHYLEKLRDEGVDIKKAGLSTGKIIAVNDNDAYEPATKIYDLSMTRNVVQMLVALALLVWLLLSSAKKYQRNGPNKSPSGMQNAIESVITFIRDEVAKPNLGHHYEKYMPYILTVFFFILINNIFGLLPGSANVTGNIAFTLVLALVSFVVILFSTNKHFWSHIFWPPVPHGIKFILIPVEFLGIFTKPFALMIRLFANMVAGHMVITCLIMLIFIFGSMTPFAGYGFSPVSLGFTIFIYMIEILVAFIQAFIFANLTAVFIGQAFEGEHHDGNDHIEDPVII
ncbi:MAG: atpB [Chitinophagaceae bacterium]|nr:atpB [Chitinophagaceae bacterium]